MARRYRSRESYDRRAPKREPYDVVTIICEGGKTEPNYFEGLKTAYRLSSANVDVQPLGRDPLSLVNHAIAELEADGTLTCAYCVFDRDTHPTFGDAVRKARDHVLGKNGRLRVAVSVPCFEVWPLLHFGYSTAPIEGGGNKTPGEQACSLLQKVMPEYSKNDRGIFERLAPRLEAAMVNAGKLCSYNNQADADNPSTSVHELVRYLMGIKT